MSNWVRLWNDMPTDPKWRVIAKRSGRTITDVIAVFNFMMICAANADERGELSGWNDEDVAIALDLEPDHVLQIRNSMEGKVIQNYRLMGWEKRQPLREDNSAERAKQWRERKRTEENAPERPESESDQIRSEQSRVESRAPARAGPNSTPKDFQSILENETPNAQQIADAEKFGINTHEAVEAEFEHFRDYNLATGKKLADWDAAWRSWLAKTGEFKPKQAVKHANGHATGPPKAAPIQQQKIFIDVGTPQWNAWDEWWKKSNGGIGPPRDQRKGGHPEGGWWFPTPYPPSPG
jgi:hypothetical protein